jgi:hypothetical protein
MAKSRFWQRRIVASRMTIRQDQPWPIKFATVILVLGLSGALALWTYDLGRKLAFGHQIRPEQVEDLQKQVDEMKLERDKLASQANTADSQQSMERSTQKQLADQIKSLTAENLKLKDDLAFFESLMPSATGPAGITLQRIKVDMLAPNQLRYRLLIMQGGKDVRDFSGDLQLMLTLAQGGKPVMMAFPEPSLGDAAKIKLSFRHYQRVEGIVNLPDGATVKALQAKVMDRGQIRAQQSINL